MKSSILLRATLFLSMATAMSIVVGAAGPPDGKAIYQGNCAGCHGTGAAGAPKFGDAGAWASPIKTGRAALYASASSGKGAHPARGGNPNLFEVDVKAAVDYIISQSTPAAKDTSSVASKALPAATAKPAVAAPVPAKPAVPALPPAPAAAKPAEPIVNRAPAAPPVANAPSTANALNRLMRPPAQRNLPPAEDGIHDPGNDGTHLLQAPLIAFATLPKSNDGNRVDWVKSLNESKISPRFDRNDPNATPMILDLNIVSEVKGSTPDVVFPHKQHSQWLDCSSCHPAIFVAKKGANQTSMAAIMLGQSCGVCHGTVAFPVSDCRRCHPKTKAVAKP